MLSHLQNYDIDLQYKKEYGVFPNLDGFWSLPLPFLLNSPLVFYLTLSMLTAGSSCVTLAMSFTQNCRIDLFLAS